MRTFMLGFRTIPATLWFCKGCQFMLEHSTIVAGAGQIVFLVVDCI